MKSYSRNTTNPCLTAARDFWAELTKEQAAGLKGSNSSNTAIPRVIVAFSGGSDSLGALVALSKVVPQGSLIALYVNHQLRSEAELQGEISLNESNCEKLGVQFVAQTVPNGAIEAKANKEKVGIEAAAREERKALLESFARSCGAVAIVTGHTQNDLDESDIMAFFHGTYNPRTLSIPKESGMFRRPFLGVTKDELRELCKAEGLCWSDDTTNFTGENLRSKIRTSLLTFSAEVFPNYNRALNNARKEAQNSRFCPEAFVRVMHYCAQGKHFEIPFVEKDTLLALHNEDAIMLVQAALHRASVKGRVSRGAAQTVLELIQNDSLSNQREVYGVVAEGSSYSGVIYFVPKETLGYIATVQEKIGGRLVAGVNFDCLCYLFSSSEVLGGLAPAQKLGALAKSTLVLPEGAVLYNLMLDKKITLPNGTGQTVNEFLKGQGLSLLERRLSLLAVSPLNSHEPLAVVLPGRGVNVRVLKPLVEFAQNSAILYNFSMRF